MAKDYNTVKDLLDMLDQDYTDNTYCHIFAIVTDDDWLELEQRVEALMYIKGELNPTHYEDGTSTEEFLEIYGVEA